MHWLTSVIRGIYKASTNKIGRQADKIDSQAEPTNDLEAQFVAIERKDSSVSLKEAHFLARFLSAACSSDYPNKYHWIHRLLAQLSRSQSPVAAKALCHVFVNSALFDLAELRDKIRTAIVAIGEPAADAVFSEILSRKDTSISMGWSSLGAEMLVEIGDPRVVSWHLDQIAGNPHNRAQHCFCLHRILQGSPELVSSQCLNAILETPEVTFETQSSADSLGNWGWDQHRADLGMKQLASSIRAQREIQGASGVA